MAEFLLLALLAGAGVAIPAGPLGALVVWRRMAFFGDALAHSALLGVALGLLLNWPLKLSVIIGCAMLALGMAAFQRHRWLANDTLLGIFSHSTLALGLVAIALMGNVRVDLMAFLFGDILAVTWADVAAITAVAVLTLGALAFAWNSLLNLTVHEELAAVEGAPVQLLRLLLMLLLALMIGSAMKVVGVLLITSLLVIPAATARRLCHTPEQMALVASGLGVLAVVLGLGASLWWDTPAGPSIVLGAALLFVLSLFRPQRD